MEVQLEIMADGGSLYGGVLHLEDQKAGGGMSTETIGKIGFAVIILIILVIIYFVYHMVVGSSATQGMQGEMRSTVGWNPSSRVFGVPITKASLAPIVREGHPVVQVSDPYGINLVPWRSNLGPNVPASDSAAREGLHAGK